MDPVEMLIDGAIQHEVLQNRNPYLMMETIILRLYNKISEHTGVQHYQIEKTVLFSNFHAEILDAYELIKSKMSHEEKTSVERVLSKDCPHPTELTKFACAWYKYDQFNACKWFAVDGIVGLHPKTYVQDAFSKTFEGHNAAVRQLYSFYNDPEIIKQIVCKALNMEEEEETFASDPDIDRCVGLYGDMVGENEMKYVATERRSKLQAQQQPSKRKKKNPLPSTPEPKSPVNSP